MAFWAAWTLGEKTMNAKDIAILVLIAGFIANSAFIFRFQRTTLGICREMFGADDWRVQAVMTPAWVGFLGWTHRVLIFVVSGVLWKSYGWPFALGAFVYGFLGLALMDVISPLPTYRFCFRLIEGELDKRKKEDDSGEISRFKERVLAVKSNYGV